jgi:hypothetical protein
MRSITKMASLAVLALPLMSFSSSARADSGDLMNQAQKFFNNGNNGNDSGSYQRGRDDEMRRQQADRDRQSWRREHDRDVSGYARDRDDRYRNPNYR